MGSEEQVYQVVAARRLQWDALVWQVPVLSLTAQAFLFTIAVGAGTSEPARVLSACLSLVLTFLSIELMSRHRQAEITDARWLEAYEQEHFAGLGSSDPERYVVHGATFRSRRNATSTGPLGKLPGYWTWLTGLSLFGVAAVVVLLLVGVHPAAFK